MDFDSEGSPQLSATQIQDALLQQLHEIKHNEMCSDHDFLSHMPGIEECHGTNLRGFWFPKTTESSKISGFVSSPPESKSIEEKVTSLILSQNWGRDVLVQFWAPIVTKKGRMMLSVKGQPFGMSYLFNGFCGYRHSCIRQESLVEDINQLGPLGRVFSQGSLEYCLDIHYCSDEEFPLKHIAKHCGIKAYCVLPLFEWNHDSQPFAGVLEILSFQNYISPETLTIKNKGLTITKPHCRECQKVS
ncbi:OLC1v1004950C1 [Oldenlandia corymbosa var. corymbosa]|uniref:OLC1v1004950C1 n=1 Tax=Oldenlandia corymbosa var. corymbosa TaxID=529605 RepID=A0AAV1DGF7_OLDCO|nr:OLC1v1004950C1 [Oldenlandia corymbosa var. corymbosa]